MHVEVRLQSNELSAAWHCSLRLVSPRPRPGAHARAGRVPELCRRMSHRPPCFHASVCPRRTMQKRINSASRWAKQTYTSCNGVMHVTTRGHTSGPACAWTAAKVNAHTARKEKGPIHLRAAHLRGLALRSPTPNATLARAMHARERAVVAASASGRKHEQAQCVKTLRAHPLR